MRTIEKATLIETDIRQYVARMAAMIMKCPLDVACSHQPGDTNISSKEAILYYKDFYIRPSELAKEWTQYLGPIGTSHEYGLSVSIRRRKRASLCSIAPWWSSINRLKEAAMAVRCEVRT